MFKFSKTLMAASLGLVLSLTLVNRASAVDEVTGAGSTFVYPILSKWAADYNQKTGKRINYQAIGSGGGIAQIKADAVDFGASDMPLKSADLANHGLGQFPLVIGGVVPVMNLSGIAPGTLKFSGAVIADIFLGKISKWNDPAIVALNPNQPLPNKKIVVVYRSDDSGTTYNWVNYLSSVSPAWQNTIGSGVSVKWPTGFGAKGSEGVATYVKQVPDSIGYLEYAYSKQNNLNFGLLQNKAGNFVAPTVASFQAAAASANWDSSQDFNTSMINASGDNAYPVTATTFVVMARLAKDAERRQLVLDFFKWSLEDGKAQASALNFVPLPDALTQQVEAYWTANKMTP